MGGLKGGCGARSRALFLTTDDADYTDYTDYLEIRNPCNPCNPRSKNHRPTGRELWPEIARRAWTKKWRYGATSAVAFPQRQIKLPRSCRPDGVPRSP